MSLPAQGAQYDANPADVQAYDVVTGKLAVGVPRDSASGRVRLRHLAAGGVQEVGRRPQLERVDGRRAARHRVHQLRQPAVRFLRRRSQGRQPVRQLAGRARCPNRPADVASPARASRPVGLRPAAGAEAADDPSGRHATSTSSRRRRSTGSCSSSSARPGGRSGRSRSARFRSPTSRASAPRRRSRSRPGRRRSPASRSPRRTSIPICPRPNVRRSLERMKTLRNEGLFTPPSFEGSISLPGHNGGANFQTSAVDPTRGEMYVFAKALPTVDRIALPAPPGAGGGRRRWWWRGAGRRRRADHHARAEGPDDQGRAGAGGRREGEGRVGPVPVARTSS